MIQVPGRPEGLNGLESPKGRLTVVTVADVVRSVAGLARHLEDDPSISSARCPAILGDVISVCRHLAPCVLVAERAFIESLDIADFCGTADVGASIKALVVLDADDAGFCQKLLKHGFSGTIRRDASPEVFGKALEAVADGELWAPRKVISALVKAMVAEDSPKQLTGREKEILHLIAQGLTNREIAETLFITRETVRWHVRSIYAKLGASNRESAIEYALITGTVLTKPPTASLPPPAGRKAVS